MIKKFESFDKEECCPSCNEMFEMCTCENEERTDVDSEEEFNEKKNWIKDAIKHPGALKKSLGKGKDEKITKSELDKKDVTKKRRLELAKTLSKLNKAVKENHEEENYMFFSNLETIKRLVDELLQMDRTEIDTMLKEHDWASDHITSSKDDIEEVFDFIVPLPDPAGQGNTEEEYDYPLTKNTILNMDTGKYGKGKTNPMQHLKSFFTKK